MASTVPTLKTIGLAISRSIVEANGGRREREYGSGRLVDVREGRPQREAQLRRVPCPHQGLYLAGKWVRGAARRRQAKIL